MGRTCLSLAAAVPSPSPSPFGALLLFSIVAALLAIFLLGVLLLMSARRRRLSRESRQPAGTTLRIPDPWIESGKRLRE